MSRPEFTVAFGVTAPVVEESLRKIGLDDTDIETVMEAELLESVYHGCGELCGSDYLGLDLGMLDESANYIPFAGLVPDGLHAVKLTKDFNDKVAEYRTSLHAECGIPAEQANKFKVPPPKAFIAVGTD